MRLQNNVKACSYVPPDFQGIPFPFFKLGAQEVGPHGWVLPTHGSERAASKVIAGFLVHRPEVFLCIALGLAHPPLDCVVPFGQLALGPVDCPAPKAGAPNQELGRVDQAVLGGLQQCNIRGLPLDTQELIELYYDTYNPDTATRQQLKNFNDLTAEVVRKGEGMAPQQHLQRELQ